MAAIFDWHSAGRRLFKETDIQKTAASTVNDISLKFDASQTTMGISSYDSEHLWIQNKTNIDTFPF